MSKTEEMIRFFTLNPGVHSRKGLVKVGAYPALLRKLVTNNILEEVSRGFYRLIDQEELENDDLETIASVIPNGVFCLQSALHFHNLGTQQAFEYHLAIPKGQWIPERNEFNIKIYQFGKQAYGSGIEKHGTIKVYSVAKTIADCFKFRNQIGLDIALEALKDVIRNKRATIAEILDQAEVCRVKNVIMPYLESMS